VGHLALLALLTLHGQQDFADSSPVHLARLQDAHTPQPS